LAFLTVPVAEPVVLIKGSGVPRIAGGSASVQKVGKLSHAPTTVPIARAWYTMADPAGPVPLSAITGLPGIPPGVPLQSCDQSRLTGASEVQPIVPEAVLPAPNTEVHGLSAGQTTGGVAKSGVQLGVIVTPSASSKVPPQVLYSTAWMQAQAMVCTGIFGMLTPVTLMTPGICPALGPVLSCFPMMSPRLPVSGSGMVRISPLTTAPLVPGMMPRPCATPGTKV